MPRCGARTKTGKQCRISAPAGSDRCFRHSAKRAPKKRRVWKPAFLKALLELGTVTAACDAAGIGRRTVYQERQRDEEFAIAWADVEAASTDQLEAEAHRRAVNGSDTLLIFLLKSRKPEIYRENVKVEHSGEVHQSVEVEIPDTDEYRRKVAELAASAFGPGS